MADQTVSAKYTGSLNWAELREPVKAQVRRAIVRDGREIVLDFAADGFSYSVKLRWRHGANYAGGYSYHGRGESGSGLASADFYRSATSGVLLGTWIEDGTEYFWWTRLDEVDHFDDETT